MMLPSALLVGVAFVVPIVDKVPALDVEQVCEGIAQQGGVSFRDSNIATEKRNCLDSERAIRDQLVKQWSSFSPADKAACTNEATMGGESSYTELLTCLEMARDVRTLRNEAQKPAASGPTPPPTATPTTTPMPRPAPAGGTQPKP
jgi:hypothetical protein